MHLVRCYVNSGHKCENVLCCRSKQRWRRRRQQRHIACIRGIMCVREHTFLHPSALRVACVCVCVFLLLLRLCVTSFSVHVLMVVIDGDFSARVAGFFSSLGACLFR